MIVPRILVVTVPIRTRLDHLSLVGNGRCLDDRCLGSIPFLSKVLVGDLGDRVISQLVILHIPMVLPVLVVTQ
jgi:hypothetical protein